MYNNVTALTKKRRGLWFHKKLLNTGTRRNCEGMMMAEVLDQSAHTQVTIINRDIAGNF